MAMINGLSEEEFFSQGHRSCSGCGSALAMRYALKAAGENTIVVQNTGCMQVVSTPYPETAWKLPYIHTAFECGAAVASGIERALKKLNKKTNILVFGGDGGTYDIGFQALSGMIERGHKVCYVCNDNEAYQNCLALDTLILTEKGLRHITKIKADEKLYVFNQKTNDLVLKRCSGVFDNGKKRIYELSTLHHNIKATSNHPLLTVKHCGRGKQNKLVWKTLEELKKGDEIIVSKRLKEGISNVFKQIKLSQKGDYRVNKINYVEIPKKSNEDLMKLLGIYVGDGWVRINRSETGFSAPKGKRARKTLIELIKKVFKIKPGESENEVHIPSINVARFIDSLGIKKGSKNKIIPPWIFTIPLKEKEAFLDGLMLSDGCKMGNSWRYGSSSSELLKRLRLFLQTMNYRVGKIHWFKSEKGKWVVYRRLLKDTEHGYICFSKKSKWNIKKYPSQFKYQNFLIENEFFDIEKVTDIQKLGIEPTLDLRVEDEHNFIADGFVVHNTGIQRSGATPKYTSTTTTPFGSKIHGKQEFKKPLPFIIAAHRLPYVATATIAYPQDFTKKVKTALSKDGPTYIQVFSPCVPGWKYPPSQTIAIAKIAAETGITPLYEITDGKLTLNKKPERKPVKEYYKTQGRFKNMNDKEIEEMQKHVDKEWEFLLKKENDYFF